MKRFLWLALLVILEIGCRSTRAVGSTYYVSQVAGAADTNACVNGNSGAAARRHVAYGIDCLNAGDTLIVQAGTYTDPNDRIDAVWNFSHSLNFRSGTSDSVRIIIQCETQYACTLRPNDGVGPGTYMQQWVVKVGDSQTGAGAKNYVTVKFFVFDGSGTISNVCGADGVGIVISDNDITGGILTNVSMGQSNSLLRNKIHDTYHTATPFICGLSNGQTDNGPCGYGLYTSISNQFLVEGNEFYRNSQYAIHAYDQPNNNGFIIRNNYFHDGAIDRPDRAGDIFMYGNSHVLYNNVFYNIPTSFAVGTYQGSSNVQLYGNTVYNYVEGFQLRGSSQVAKNNLLLSITNGAVELNSPNGACSGCTAQANLCDSGKASCAFASTPSTEWVSTSTSNLGTFLHLKTGAVAIGKGQNLGSPYNVDKDNNSRLPTAWDLGAYQFTTGGGGPPNTIPVEDFVYAAGTDLDTLGGGTNWTGPWTTVAGCGSAMIITASMPGTFTAGNAVKSSATSGFACYSRLFTEVGTGIIPWQMRNSVNNSGYRAVELQDVGGTTHAVVIAQKNDGHIHACADYANDTDLGTYNANQTYWMRVELNVSTNMGAYRVSIDNGTFSSWINFCQTPPSSQVGKMVLVDNPITTHDWWVDSIGAGPTMLAFTTQPPATVTTDVAFAANVSVTYSNGSTPVPGRTDSITLAVCPASPTATLSAASGVTKAAVNGTASWTDLVLSQPAGAVGVTLCATTTTMGITSATSNPITVNAAAPPLSEIASPPRVQARIR